MLLPNDTALEMCNVMSAGGRSDLMREQERTGRVSAPEGAAAAAAVDGAGAAAGKSAAVGSRWEKKRILNHHCTSSELNLMQLIN